MKKIRVAINGAGRIGRAFYKVAQQYDELEVVALNDLGNIDNIAYLMKYDSAYGRAGYAIEVASDKKSLMIGGKKVDFFSEKDPGALPWKALDIDVVIESTGFFTSYTKALPHITAGAKRVVISAPSKDEAGAPATPTVLLGINEKEFVTCPITSNASCTTNASSPVMAILDETIGIEKALLSTVHGYTASQSIVDAPNKKDWKEGRAAAQNIVPTSTGAAIAVTKALPQLEGKFDGVSFRVPVIAGSIADVVFIAKRNTSVEEINSILEKASTDPRWKDVFTVTKDPLVSSDIVGCPYASIADLDLTRVVDGNLVKVCAWYDNEIGYTHALVLHTIKAGQTPVPESKPETPRYT
ncbi:MAG: type I glyceraldehyde-3-phosphate dehydrogenase [Candidatus Paceibacterota bacterium]|jgi:glyceraldehyde 3-phosphate dehydrogenase